MGGISWTPETAVSTAKMAPRILNEFSWYDTVILGDLDWYWKNVKHHKQITLFECNLPNLEHYLEKYLHRWVNRA